jgi:hypothetical protein
MARASERNIYHNTPQLVRTEQKILRHASCKNTHTVLVVVIHSKYPSLKNTLIPHFFFA